MKRAVADRVLIVGAGAAGLAAARELHRGGIEAQILEARERIGGRVLTVHDPGAPVPIELGAEFVHGVDPSLWAVLREAKLPVFEMDGEHFVRDKAGLHPAVSFEETSQIFDAMRGAPEQSFADFVRSVAAPEEAKRAAAGYVEGFNAAHKERVSVAWLNFENDASDEVEGDRSFRVFSGYDSVIAYLARDLDIQLQCAVRSLRWRKGEVTAETDSGEVRAARAIVTVPFPLLRDGRFPIEPEPQTLVDARTAIATGQALRVTFRFAKSVWERHKHLSFLHSDQAFPVWWTPYPLLVPVITGWAAGPKADAMRGLSAADLRDAALRSLRAILGEDPGTPEAWHFHDWHEDAWSGGAYSYVQVNGLQAQRALSKPVEDTLYFAGEATDTTGHMGTVHGAMASGVAAARAILKG